MEPIGAHARVEAGRRATPEAPDFLDDCQLDRFAWAVFPTRAKNRSRRRFRGAVLRSPCFSFPLESSHGHGVTLTGALFLGRGGRFPAIRECEMREA